MPRNSLLPQCEKSERGTFIGFGTKHGSSAIDGSEPHPSKRAQGARRYRIILFFRFCLHSQLLVFLGFALNSSSRLLLTDNGRSFSAAAGPHNPLSSSGSEQPLLWEWYGPGQLQPSSFSRNSPPTCNVCIGLLTMAHGSAWQIACRVSAHLLWTRLYLTLLLWNGTGQKQECFSNLVALYWRVLPSTILRDDVSCRTKPSLLNQAIWLQAKLFTGLWRPTSPLHVREANSRKWELLKQGRTK